MRRIAVGYSDQPIRVLAWPAYSNKDGNPYNSLLYTAIEQVDEHVSVTEFRLRRALKTRYDILHLHWPELIFNSPRLGYALLVSLLWLILIPLLKIRGTKLVWTAHNSKEHDVYRPVLSKLMWLWFVRRVDGLIVLSESSKESVLELYPRLAQVPIVHTPHGHYRDIYPHTMTREQARRRLGFTDQNVVVGFVGAIRQYKNVPQLIKTFRDVSDSDWHLLVAGKVSDSELEHEIRKGASSNDHIDLQLTFIPNSELQIYFVASDLMVFPYQNILNSGSVLLSLSFNCPVLVPDIGSMSELQRELGVPWVSTYTGNLDPGKLRAAVRAAKDHDRSHNVLDSGYDWEEIAGETNNFFRMLVAQK